MEKFVDAVVGIIKATADRLTTRMDALEQRMAGVTHGKDGAMGPAGPAGADGKDGAPGPAGKDGERGADGAPGRDGVDGLHGKDGAPGRDGIDGAPGLAGERGEKGDPGVDGLPGLHGKDGLDGPPGRDGRDGIQGIQGERGADGLHGKDGIDGLHGKDGLDGFGFDDLDVVFDGERTITLSFTKGDRVKTFPVVFSGLPIFRGVFSEGKSYECGDMTQFGGNLYYAQRSTTQKPAESGDGAKDWKLAVRRGREGKEGPRGLEGPQGRHGKDWSGR